jgi:hypothetical protein
VLWPARISSRNTIPIINEIARRSIRRMSEWGRGGQFPASVQFMADFTTSSQIEMLLPLAMAWAVEQEQVALREGVPLNAIELNRAHQLGVKNPERVRLLCVEKIPQPVHPLLQAASRSGRFSPAIPCGLALRYGIFVREDRWGDSEVIAHELAHTAQCQHIGGLEPFLRQYLLQCAAAGYPNCRMEKEAASCATHALAASKAVPFPTTHTAGR